MLQVSTPFFGLGQALPAEMFRGAKEKVRFSDPPQVSFSDLEKLPADKLLVALWIDLTSGIIRKILLFQNFQKLTKLWLVKFESWLGAQEVVCHF